MNIKLIKAIKLLDMNKLELAEKILFELAYYLGIWNRLFCTVCENCWQWNIFYYQWLHWQTDFSF